MPNLLNKTKLFLSKLNNRLVFVFILVSLFIGPKTFAAGLVPCDGIDDCNFDTLVKMFNGLISFVLFRLPIILLVVIIAWNGVQLIMYRDRPAAIKKIRSALLNVLIGYLLIIGAYIIVKTFITLLAGDDLNFKTFFN